MEYKFHVKNIREDAFHFCRYGVARAPFGVPFPGGAFPSPGRYNFTTWPVLADSPAASARARASTPST